jgi:hypothetical protein
MSYSEKLKSPQWQRKRLEIFGAAGWTCEQCGGEKKPLHVHHSYYQQGLEPWDYPADAYHVLCEECHETRAEVERRLLRAVCGMLVQEIEELCSVIETSDHGFALVFALKELNRRADLVEALFLNSHRNEHVSIDVQLRCPEEKNV